MAAKKTHGNLLVAVTVSALIGLGLLSWLSLSSKHPEYWMLTGKHLAWLVCGGIAGFVLYLRPLDAWIRLAPVVYAVCMITWGVVEVFPQTLKSIHLPEKFILMLIAELTAIPLMLMMAHVLTSENETDLSLRSEIGILLLPVIPIVVMLHKHYDTIVSAYIVTVFMSLILAGIRRKTLIGMCYVGFLPVFYFYIIRNDFSHHRYSLGHRERDVIYFCLERLAGLTQGRLFGKGFGNGNYKVFADFETLNYQFFFGNFGEISGFVGVMLALGLFWLLSITCLRVAHRAETRYQSVIANAIGWFIGWHVWMHVGASSSLLPRRGFPLPFFSGLGPDSAVFMVMMALIFRIIKENRNPPEVQEDNEPVAID
jgi:cell division protein FtsW (lipid II flippase)